MSAWKEGLSSCLVGDCDPDPWLVEKDDLEWDVTCAGRTRAAGVGDSGLAGTSEGSTSFCSAPMDEGLIGYRFAAGSTVVEVEGRSWKL